MHFTNDQFSKLLKYCCFLLKRSVVLTACFSLVLHSIPLSVSAQSVQTAAPKNRSTGPLSDLSEEEAKALLVAVQSQAERVSAFLQQNFEPASVAHQIGPDPIALAAWVDQNTSLIAYSGSLKSPKGVLTDRSGNSLDRARLLAELLTTHGFEVRFVRQVIDQASIRETLVPAANSSVPWVQIDPTALGSTDLLATALEDANIESEALRDLIEAPTSTTTMKTAFDKVYPLIAAAAGEGDPERTTQEEESVVKVLSDHWSIEFKQADGWLHLPLHAGLAPPTDGDPRFRPNEIPEYMFQRLEIAVRAGRIGDDAAATLLSVSRSVQEIEAEEVSISVLPLAKSETGNLLMPPDPVNQGIRTVLAYHEKKVADADVIRDDPNFLPVIRIGQEFYSDQAVGVNGEIVDRNTARAQSSSMGSAVKSIGDVFGSFTGGQGPSSEEAESWEPFNIWLEVTSFAPDQPKETVRRLITTQPHRSHEALTSDPSAFLRGTARTSTLSALTGRPVFEALLARQAAYVANMANAFVSQDFETVSPRQQLNDRFEARRWYGVPSDKALYLARPTIILQTVETLSAGSYFVFDIAMHLVAVRSEQRRQGRELRIRQGVIDTLAEAFDLVRPGNSASALVADPVNLVSIGSRNDQARFLNWTANLEPSQVRYLDAESSIHDDESSLLWRITSDGTTIGLDPLGRGASLTEGVVVDLIELNIVPCLITIGVAGAFRIHYYNKKNYISAGLAGLGVLLAGGCIVSNAAVSAGMVTVASVSVANIGNILVALSAALGVIGAIIRDNGWDNWNEVQPSVRLRKNPSDPKRPITGEDLDETNRRLDETNRRLDEILLYIDAAIDKGDRREVELQRDAYKEQLEQLRSVVR